METRKSKPILISALRKAHAALTDLKDAAQYCGKKRLVYDAEELANQVKAREQKMNGEIYEQRN